MQPSSVLRLDLPLAGMTCAACAARIEKNLNKLPGVTANVNFAAESALVTVEPGTTSPVGVIESIRKTGYSVPDRVAELTLFGMTCAACAAVSYTHLRAHETRHDLVCRLLLEK